MLDITVLVNFHGVKTGLEALEFTDDGSKIVRLLNELHAALRVRVAKEIKCAGGHDLLACLRLVLPVFIDGCGIESNDITGSDSRSALPLNALLSFGLASAIIALALLLAVLGLMRAGLLIALAMGCASATTDKTILLKGWGTIAWLRLSITLLWLAVSLLLLAWGILLLLLIR